MARKPYQVGGRVVEVIIKEGDRLPKGVFVTAWKLDPQVLGPGRFCLHYIPEEDEK